MAVYKYRIKKVGKNAFIVQRKETGFISSVFPIWETYGNFSSVLGEVRGEVKIFKSEEQAKRVVGF